ncbi:hypothetical protein [Rhodoferax sp. GW822-FHT02A01]|uniref:hypothetical protein n=1 Tax=Rhodoferax sp. GW822-FHT02A01 TaxID=3141537 RepID=UPI00315D8216
MHRIAPTISTPTVKPNAGHTTFQVTEGPDLQTLIAESVRKVESCELRRFLCEFLAEPEILELLGTPLGDAKQYQRTGLCRYAVQILRSAADTAAYASDYGGAEREALYVATFVEGCHAYLRSSMGAHNAEDVLRTLVLAPLHRLDNQSERLAGLLRMCLDWSLPDEMDDFYVPRLRHCVQRALSRVNGSAGRCLPRVAARPASNLSCY